MTRRMRLSALALLVVAGISLVAVLSLSRDNSTRGGAISPGTPQATTLAQLSNQDNRGLPGARHTIIPPAPIAIPYTIPPTPIIVSLAAPVIVTPVSIFTASPASAMQVRVERAIDTVSTLRDAVQSVDWLPSGDSFIMVGEYGFVYSSSTDGSNVSELHNDVDPTHDQMPLTNTLFLEGSMGHLAPFPSGGTRGGAHLDVIGIVDGQAAKVITAVHLPFEENGPGTSGLANMHWWSQDRASGVSGEQLVTLDARGSLVESRQIPFMGRGAVQPGGRWLAYTTHEEHLTENRDVRGSEPNTDYLLDLSTGERLQISSSRAGGGVVNWSRDGRWIVTAKGLVSADGRERIDVPAGIADGSWSHDSKRFAFSTPVQRDKFDDLSTPVPYNSSVYVLDVSSRSLFNISQDPNFASVSRCLGSARWAPRGNRLALVNKFGIGCPAQPPNIYIVSIE